MEFHNYQTPCLSASTESTGKKASREDAQDSYPSHQNQPNKNPSATCMLEISSDLFRMTTRRKYLLSKGESSAGEKPKLVSPAEWGGQSEKPEAVPPITGGSSPFFPTLSLCCCLLQHTQLVSALPGNLPHLLSLPSHHTWTQPLFRQAPPELLPISFPQFVAAFGCIVNQKCCSSSWAAPCKQQKNPLESSKVPPPLFNSPKQRSLILCNISITG